MAIAFELSIYNIGVAEFEEEPLERLPAECDEQLEAGVKG
jgi:hypothetical protein